MSAGPRTQFDLVEDFWRQLLVLDERVVERARRAAARRRLRRTLAFAVLTLLAAAAIAIATGLFARGDDVKPQLPSSRVLVLARLPGTLQIVPTTAPDPDGGPPWSMRLFFTESEVCFQVGRLVNGQLAVLGIGGAFGDDQRYHVLPVEAEGCGGNRGGHALQFGGGGLYYSSGLSSSYQCRTPGRTPSSRSAPCAVGEPRTVIFGGAGPHLVDVTLRTAGQEISQHVVDRRYGTFMFVLRGPPEKRGELVGRYDDGSTCHIPSNYDIGVRFRDSRACIRRRMRP